MHQVIDLDLEPPNKRPRLDPYSMPMPFQPDSNVFMNQQPFMVCTACAFINLFQGGPPYVQPDPGLQPILAHRGLATHDTVWRYMSRLGRILSFKTEPSASERGIKLTKGVVEYMCLALEQRMLEVAEEVVQISHQRLDLEKDTRPIEVSANPRKIIRDIQQKEKEESARSDQSQVGRRTRGKETKRGLQE
jgi:hypothetical protein